MADSEPLPYGTSLAKIDPEKVTETVYTVFATFDTGQKIPWCRINPCLLCVSLNSDAKTSSRFWHTFAHRVLRSKY